MKTLNYLLLLVSVFLFNIVLSQDKIFLRTGEEINAFIVEKSEKQIKYKIMDSDNSPIIILKTEKVEKIVFRNGLEMAFPDLIRMNRRFGIDGGLMYGLGLEAAFYKIGADYFFSPGFNLGLNLLIDSEDGSGIEIGPRYFFNPYNPKRLKGFTGLLVGVFYEDLSVRAPFGINYVGDKGFDFKLAVSGLYIPSETSYGTFSELTFGWRF